MSDVSSESENAAVRSQTLSRLLREALTPPPAMAFGALVLGILSLLPLPVADDIGQLNTSDDLGIGLSLPGSHAHQIAVGVRLAVSVLALVFAISAVRRLFGRRIATDDSARRAWAEWIVGAAALVTIVAFLLNLVAFVVALAHGSTIGSVYNHIGS